MNEFFFESPAAFRRWLRKNHGKESELLVGFYKVGSDRPSMTWPESVDEALCFGWIDGVRRRIDDVSYSIRFTPRKPSSTWSSVNMGRVAELTRLGRMEAAGLAAFRRRQEGKSAIYCYENSPRSLDPEDEAKFRADEEAWRFFSAQPPSYRRLAVYRIVSAKRADTRTRRLKALIENSGAGKRTDG